MYSVHHHAKNYKSVLGILSSTKTNSTKTSSLPLADFWRPERFKEMEEFCNAINIKVESLNPEKADYYFEYPTPAYEDEKHENTIEFSKPSMTDLMIILNKTTRITIEAKYTEYVEDSKYSPLLKSWYEKDIPNEKTLQDKTKILENRKNILNCWIKYINNRGHSIPLADVLLDKYPELPYQFLHRTASACFDCKRPILVYQLFYDNTPESTDKLKEFKGHLAYWANELQLKLPFFIIETEVDSESLALKGHKDIEDPSDLFIYMKNEKQYTFGDSKVHDVYKLEPLTPQH